MDKKPTVTDRDMMCKLFRQYDGNHADVIAGYAKAEQAGEVDRSTDRGTMCAEAYARKLWGDGMRKRWLQ